MNYLGISVSELEKIGGIHTAREISQQPVLWQKIYRQMEGERAAISDFINRQPFQRIILTGAGTSAFIGLSLRGAFQKNTGIVTEAISTTDLVSHPQDYLLANQTTLLVSFARSGNSPESVAAVELADKLCSDCHHFIITCNAEGKLANHPVQKSKYVFTLPPEANDQSLAMTSSYSGMLLAGKLVAQLNDFASASQSVSQIAKYAEKSIVYYADRIKQIASLDFKRAVFLGAGPLVGTATEAHLKLQELTDGKVVSKHDSFLGFRHGPKAVVDSTTLVVYFFSNSNYAFQYEQDLVASMKKGKKPLAEIAITEKPISGLNLDQVFSFSENGLHVDEEFLAVANIVPAQVLAFYKSIALGLKPDSPSETGAISRVVEGVKIYTY